MKIPIRNVNTERTIFLTGEDVFNRFRKIARLNHLHHDHWVILADDNTWVHCLPLLLNFLPELANARVMTIPAGEQEKTLARAAWIWKEWNKFGIGRSNRIICLGGGMVTDLGGFAAAAYHRGLPVVHIPTSLIGQLDAAIGGKVAVNLDDRKNQVGFFHVPDFVLVYPPFLKTLPARQIHSGIAEMAKSHLLGNPETWHKMKRMTADRLAKGISEAQEWRKWVLPAIQYKISMVRRDFHERNLRKVLNFGHTLGHAFETLSLRRDSEPMTHGDAVAAGMVCAAKLSVLKTGLFPTHLEDITTFLTHGFQGFPIATRDIPELLDYLKSDKKNRDSHTGFTLLRQPGKAVLNCHCTSDEITAALEYYRNVLIPAT